MLDSPHPRTESDESILPPQGARGTEADYERYLAGMDQSMQQKVALTAAHVLGQGKVADMGMGSGTGSEALAALYPNISVVGVDLNPEMVERARARYQRPNLTFVQGDIGQACFEPESLDAIFNSSVLHHLTSFNGYRPEAAREAIENQVRQLKMFGSLIVRDFVRPESGLVYLDLPDETAGLLETFSREFRFLLPESQRGFELSEKPSPRPGWRRFELDLVHAVEFVLRKDYQEDWSTEVLEEYTYFTQRQFEEHFQQLGLRILASTPIWNPWIVENRFRNHFELVRPDGEPLEYPPTNTLIVGERVSPECGVTFRAGAEHPPLGYLELTHYEHRATGALRDLVRRPHLTVDAVPYFELGGELYILARKSYPRPLLSLCQDRLDQARSPCYVTEPITVIQGDKPLAQTVEEVLEAWAGLDADQLLEFTPGSHTYPSPGGVQEEMRSLFVKIPPLMVSQARDQVRAIEAQQLLRAAQVGGLPDSRLEVHVFELMQRLGRSPGPWVGGALKLTENDREPRVTALSDLLNAEPRRTFRRSRQGSDFLHLGCLSFTEETAAQLPLREIVLEYVKPKNLSLQTVAVAPLIRHGGRIFFGLVDDDLPAAQCFRGHSNLPVTPAWRLPSSVGSRRSAEAFLLERLQQENGLEVLSLFELGGPYFPSPGVTPEVVLPYACEVRGSEEGSKTAVHWVDLQELIDNFQLLRDGHLKTLVSRAARAFEH